MPRAALTIMAKKTIRMAKSASPIGPSDWAAVLSGRRPCVVEMAHGEDACPGKVNHYRVHRASLAFRPGEFCVAGILVGARMPA